MKKWIIVGLILVVFSACKKKDNHWSLNVNVKEDLGLSALSGAEVKLQGKKLSSGVFNDVWTDVAAASTDGAGNANVHFERDSYAAMQLEVSRPNYFTEVVALNPDDFEVGETLERYVNLTPMSTVLVYLKTTDPSASISLQIFSNQDQCNCDDLGLIEIGGSEEYSHVCYAAGGRWIKYQINSNGPSGPLQYFDSLYVEPFVQNTLDYIY